jgi:hypothetical protein
LTGASYRWPQYPINSVSQVGSDKIRLRLPFRGIPEKFAFPITCSHEDTSRPAAVGKLDICMTITQDERPVQVQSVFPRPALQHSSFRFAAVAAVRGNVRAIVYGVEPCSRVFELSGHNFVDPVHKRLRKMTPANARLIRNHNHGKPRFVQAANRFCDSRQDTKSADVIQVANLFRNSSVAIEKDSGTQRGGFRQGAPRSRKSTFSPLLLRHLP